MVVGCGCDKSGVLLCCVELCCVEWMGNVKCEM